MKHSEFERNFWFVVLIIFLCLIVANAAQSQEAKTSTLAPALTPQVRLDLFAAQHEKDAIAKQKSDLSAQLAQIQNQANAQYADIDRREKAAAAKFDELWKKALGADASKWEPDPATMQPRAITIPGPVIADAKKDATPSGK